MKQPSTRPMNALLVWLNKRFTPPAIDAPAELSTPLISQEDPVVTDEKTRINDLRTVAKWQLASLGAVATIAFTGVALNKLPNAAMAETGGWIALGLAGSGALLTLTSVVMIIRSVGRVLAPQFVSLNDQLRDEFKSKSSTKRQRAEKWYNQGIFYLPDPSIRTLEEFTKRQLEDYKSYDILKKKQNLSVIEKAHMEKLASKFADYYDPVALRLHWRNRRETVAIRTRAATQQLSLFGTLAALGIVFYLGGNSYHLPETKHTVNLPVYGVWRPLNATKPELTHAALAADLGNECPLLIKETQGEGVEVIVLEEIPDAKTYQIVVVHPNCNLRQYVVSRDTIAARDAFPLPSSNLK